jgi:hypothetical protein
VLVSELALELDELGRDTFRAHYGLHFVVFTQRDLIDQAADFVNTSSRDIGDILAGRSGAIDAYPLAQGRVTLGRNDACDVPVKHRRVSSLHAVFTRGGGLLWLADLGSKHGTKVNGAPLSPHEPVLVEIGDIVEFGPVKATLWGLDELAAAARR